MQQIFSEFVINASQDGFTSCVYKEAPPVITDRRRFRGRVSGSYPATYAAAVTSLETTMYVVLW
jgi:hypothetical protein